MKSNSIRVKARSRRTNPEHGDSYDPACADCGLGPAYELPRRATKSAILKLCWYGHMSRRPLARGFIGRCYASISIYDFHEVIAGFRKNRSSGRAIAFEPLLVGPVEQAAGLLEASDDGGDGREPVAAVVFVDHGRHGSPHSWVSAFRTENHEASSRRGPCAMGRT